MSEANVESCAGFAHRSSQRLSERSERWTYLRDACQVAITFEGGYVSKVDFSQGSSGCPAAIERCLAR